MIGSRDRYANDASGCNEIQEYYIVDSNRPQLRTYISGFILHLGIYSLEPLEFQHLRPLSETGKILIS